MTRLLKNSALLMLMNKMILVTFYRLVNQRVSNRSSARGLIDDDGAVLADSLDKANAF